MAVLLSLLTACLFGTSDFFGGLAGRRMKILELLVAAHIVGLGTVIVAALIMADEFTVGALGWGALGGAFGFVGLGLLYRGLARGPMGVVAPLTAVTSAAVPGLWGVVVEGDSLGVGAWVGIVLALVAIAMVSASTDDSTSITAVGLVEALLAGTGFGFMFVALAQTDAATAPWPIVGARILTVVCLVAFFVAKRRPVVPRDSVARRLVVAVGVLDTTSNAVFLWAQQAGSLTVVAVLSSLYPVMTVLLARFALGERLSVLQKSGFVAATVATILIAAG